MTGAHTATPAPTPPAAPAPKSAPEPAPESTTLSQVGPGRWRIDGVLDLTTVGPLSRQCPAADELGRAEVDLSGVRRSASAGVALLLEWQSRLHAKGARLHLTGVPEPLLRLAVLVNVSELLGLDAPPGPADAALEPAAAASS